jgi:nucleoside-diphosphate-sugar epimerase/glycosyltransferase involved in cell wall biosynthesis
LLQRGDRVRAVDIAPVHLEVHPNLEVLQGNLCDAVVCRRAVAGVRTVMHFAANMGGMGAIHGDNDTVIYAENSSMTQQLASAALEARVSKFFYASSACVYPESLQGAVRDCGDVKLREEDVHAGHSPIAQGLYGQEKLATELYLQHLAPRMDIRVARFHNVFGPGGVYDNGREKAPAALLRKAIAIHLMSNIVVQPDGVNFELWGAGTQRRSFVYIDDAVDGILRLLDSQCPEPMNIGSDRSVSIRQLAEIALKCAGVRLEDVTFVTHNQMPVGVASRNADLTKVKKVLGWEPKVTLEEGMEGTAIWMLREMQTRLKGLGTAERTALLQRWTTSSLVNLEDEAATFAILLPITSKGAPNGESSMCLKSLATFAESLARTTSAELNALGQRFAIRIYLAIDHDDHFLLPDVGDVASNRAADVLRSYGFTSIHTSVCAFPRGHVCSLWRTCARQAFEDGCEYLVLMGDDIVLQDRGWMRNVHDEFLRLAKQEGVPPGFGCVAFTDESFPGMPTFPVISRIHMEIFNGEVVPEVFVNQDGDPYLFQLYRRWGCSSMIPSRLRNMCGGEFEARYTKQSAVGWTIGPLTQGVTRAQAWLDEKVPGVQQRLTLDVVVPSYRVQVPLLDKILSLRTSSTCSTMFIIIIDDPRAQGYHELMRKYGARPDMRIRRHTANLGASAARNRGLAESSADWVQFLDDDVEPQADLLLEAENAIRKQPNAVGFVGDTRFPPADTIFKTAVHLASVTYFWGIATKQTGDLPWGVTANIIARRNVTTEDRTEFDLCFPKTGGGEDIDYCVVKDRLSASIGGKGFQPASNVVATHPWWNEGARSYWRFYMWSKGDGQLVQKYPEFAYRDYSPNGAESLATSLAVFATGSIACISAIGLRRPRVVPTTFMILGAKLFGSALLAHVVHDAVRLLLDWSPSYARKLNSTLTGSRVFLAVMESAFIRLWSETGRLVGVIQRREWSSIGRRFDWFTGKAGSGPRDHERRMNIQRLVLGALVFGGMSLLQ